MRKNAVLAVIAWLVVAGTTAGAATAALDALGSGLLGANSAPLTQADVERRLAGASPAAPGGGPSTGALSPAPATGSAAPAGAGTPRPSATTGDATVLSTSGGTVVARCTAGQVGLGSWSPALGYRADGADPGPGTSAWVRFKSGHTELLVTVTCQDGTPTASTSTDDHG